MQDTKTKVALIYDFDETLSTQYMQDFALIPQFGMEPDEFWKKANKWSRENDADQVTGSMYYFMKTAKELDIPLTKENFAKCGKSVKYFPGVLDWFERINRFGASLDLDIEHYIISSGYEEILCGASISKYFTDIYGCSYAFGDTRAFCSCWMRKLGFRFKFGIRHKRRGRFGRQRRCSSIRGIMKD